jgi:hypothetical protein
MGYAPRPYVPAPATGASSLTGEPIQVSGGNSQTLQYSWSGDGWFDGLTTSRNGILTDTWTPGHAQRDASGRINLFQDYNVQSLHFHEYNDDLMRNKPQSFDAAVAQSVLLIRQANGNDPVNTASFFDTTKDAGIGLAKGAAQAEFWRTLLNGIPKGGK